jgi:hypothetical protein
MSDWILWYILIMVKAYFEAGLFVVFVFLTINYVFPSGERFTWRDFLIILFFHPIVVYHFIKELYKNE